ncbi:hypothetical protein BDV38DRAFT_286641 [Aspergillus pseudotamarii]|uniref:Uncharacterized protein n=1 Tax=Aspergillus pseudotamarii TaxID=132259 RepID=A0A5N6SIV2_ASPPS|nr:uncharacterized protein BDV38DRAFT_286641 [Aspergillus pseudotamarii]KAE8133601.1 hypothetical protein BDV38DRAFT_286641 [Aspergillus pseudotamarii]
MRHLQYIPLLACSIVMGTESIAWRGQAANIRDLRDQRSITNNPSILLENGASSNNLAIDVPLASDQILSIIAARVLVGLINSQLPTILANHSQNNNAITGYPATPNNTMGDLSNIQLHTGLPGDTFPTGLLLEGSLGITSAISTDGAKAENAPTSFSTDRMPQGIEAIVDRLLMALRTLGAAMLLMVIALDSRFGRGLINASINGISVV